MSFKKLLLATSIAALTATSASALSVTESLPAGPLVPAEEVLAPVLPFGATETDTFRVDINTTGNIPNAQNFDVTIELPAGLEFSASLTGAELVAPLTGASAIVASSSGQAGDTSVTYVVSVDPGASVNNLQFDFPVAYSGCASVAAGGSNTVATMLFQNTTTPVEEGTATAVGAPQVGACVDGFSLTAAANSTTEIQLAPATYISLNDAIVGSITGSIAAAARDIQGTAIAASDISSVTFDVEFEDASAFTSATFLTSTVSPVGNTVSFTVPSADIAAMFGGSNDITVVTNGGVIVAQQLAVSDMTINYSQANATTIATEVETGANIDELTREGQEFGAFDWTSGSDGSTTSVFRITGLDTMAPTDYSVELKNAEPVSANGVYTGTIPNNAEGVFSLNSKKGFGKPGSNAELDGLPVFKNADVILNFETDRPLDVDRLLSLNGVVTSFNDGSNIGSNTEITPNNDGDNGNE